MNTLLTAAEATALLTSALLSADPKRRVSAYLKQYGDTYLPEVLALHMPDGAGHHKDNLDHTLRVVAMAPNRLRPRLGALLHDIGKPSTRRITKDKVTFYNHERVGEIMARNLLQGRFDFDEATVTAVAQIVRYSGTAAEYDASWTDSAVRRFGKSVDAAVMTDLLDFARIDCTSRHVHKRERAKTRISELRERLSQVAEIDAAAAKRPVLDGRTVMELLGLTPGPDVGAAMAVLETLDDVTADEAAVLLLRAWTKKMQPNGDGVQF